MDIGDPNVYVISLDAIDLNLLPSMYNTQSDRIAPLWRKSNLDRRNNEYYQFEIKSEKYEERIKDGPPKRKVENIICELCDIEVPKPFLSEHQKSPRHITNIKIADIALQRMKKHLNNTDYENGCTDSDEVDQSTCFCAICGTLFDSKEKIAHEKSLAHKNGEIVEKVLNLLLMYYSQEYGAQANVNNNDLDAKLNVDIFGSTKRKPEPSNKLMEIKNYNVLKKVEVTKSMSLSDYLDILNKRVDHQMVFKLENNNNLIEIKTIDGSVVKVTEESFHGFANVGRKNVQCYLCKEIFKKKVVEGHKMNEKHIQNMLAPLADKHCIRQINDALRHCLICNTMTEYSHLHSLCDTQHEENLKEALVSDKTVENEQYSHKELGKDFASVVKNMGAKETANKCIEVTNKIANVDVDNSITIKGSQKVENGQYSHKELGKDFASVLKNVEGKEKANKYIELTNKIPNVDVENSITIKRSQQSHMMPDKYLCTECNEYISIQCRSKHIKTVKHIIKLTSNIYYQMRQINNKLICLVCDVEIRNDAKHIEEHFKTEHYKKYSQLLAHNKIRQNKDNTDFYCEPCDQLLLVKDELMHINEKSHRTKLYPVEDIMEVTEENEGDNEVKRIEYYICDVCNVKVPNNEHNIQEHLNGKSHASNVEKQSPTSDSDDDSATNEVPTIHYHLEQSKLPKLLNCKVCKVSILHNDINISEHLASVKHSLNYNKLLTDNHLVLETNDCYCNICKVTVGVKSEFIHAIGKKHNKLLKKLESSNVSVATDESSPAIDTTSTHTTVVSEAMINAVANEKDVNNIDISIPNSDNNLVFPDNPDFEPAMLALLQATSSPSAVICKICKVTVPFNEYNISTHMNGMKHKLAHKALIEQEELD